MLPFFEISNLKRNNKMEIQQKKSLWQKRKQLKTSGYGNILILGIENENEVKNP